MKEKTLGMFTSFASFASFVLIIVENLSRWVVLRCSTNAPRTNKTFPLLSSQLQQLPPRTFFDMLNEQPERLQVTLSPEKIENRGRVLKISKGSFGSGCTGREQV